MNDWMDEDEPTAAISDGEDRVNHSSVTSEDATDTLALLGPSTFVRCSETDRVLARSVSMVPEGEAVYQRLKLLKRGHREAMVSRSCGVRFEGLPFWLWTIRLAEWSTIYITGTDEVALRQYHVSTWEYVKERLVLMDDGPGTVAPIVDMWMISGTLRFIGTLEERLGSTPRVVWMSDGGRRPPKTMVLGYDWKVITHAMVGGVTKASGVFGTAGFDGITVNDDPIRRTIGHIIKYSERPIPCVIPVADSHYGVSDRLSLHDLDRPVVFASGFSRSGWGQRPLVESELAHAFDLPPFVPWSTVEKSKILPLHMFRVILDAALATMRPESQLRGQKARTTSEGSILEGFRVAPLPLDRAWLPGVERWLPGSWSATAIADKAVKSDDARVDFHPWHQRILLLFPCPAAVLVSMEEFALRRWRRSLASSFRTYLLQVHGPHWFPKWTLLKAGLPVSGALDAPNQWPPRRQVLDGDTPENNQGGTENGNRIMWSATSDHDLLLDVAKGRLVLEQVLQSKWWEWSHGSALFFWRWNGREQITAARDGMRIFVRHQLPIGRKRMKKVRLSPEVKLKVAEKIDGMCTRYYLEASGFVSNTLNYFAVPKGDEDIRVVFDGTSCGLNATLFAPNFGLPSANSAAWLLTSNTWMADMDFGEMFHNFPMEEKMRRCSGVEFESQEKGAGGGKGVKLLRWTRMFMGMRPSPYIAVRYYYWGEEFARGDPGLSSNPMGFDTIRLNLPGMDQYDPTLPKVMKWRSELGVVAGDVLTFIDDVRITGYSKENCHEVHRQFASRIQYLGMQDAPRKFRPPSQMNAGAWTGTTFRISPDTISKSVSQEKWDKGRLIIEGLAILLQAAANGRPLLDRKRLERETGFMNHLAMTFDIVTPYLKGFYLTLNSWRPQRDEGDWKMSDRRWRGFIYEKFEKGEITEAELDMELSGKEELLAPQLVTASLSLASDVESLSAIFKPEKVPTVGVRSKHVVTVVYGFGDASGTGLGATFTCGTGLNFRIGVWGSREDPESSNWKEFTNVVEALEEEGEEGNLANAEVFMFTDNSTVESCVARGSSSSPKLLGLVVRLQALSMRIGIRINVFHIAGTRMIAQGTDGVSRGFLGQGVMDGMAMSAFVPIHLSPVERSPMDLVPWIQSWAGKEAVLLGEMGWFQEGHDVEGWKDGADGIPRPILASGRKVYIWAPAPMAAEVALAEMRKARIKRQQSAHIFVCPRLCTSQWLRHLYKAADFVFEVPVGTGNVWTKAMHEPLLIGILFPFIRVKPWQLRDTPKMHAVGRQLRQVFKDTGMDGSNLLREFWSCCLNCGDLSEPMVRKLLYFEQYSKLFRGNERSANG